MNTFKNFVTIHSQLIKTDAWEVVINTLDRLSSNVCAPRETEGLITRINESKILKKHISRESECKFDSRKCNSDQKRK